MPSYQAKNSPQMQRQLKVQEMAIPFTITANVTPASVVLACDEPGILYLKSEGVDQITGALASGETAPTYVAQNDVNGLFSILVDVNETLSKVVSAHIVGRANKEVIACTLTATPSTGITAGTGGGKKICLNADSAINLATTDYAACLIIKYAVS